MFLKLKKDFTIPRGSDESMGYHLFKQNLTNIGFEFQNVIPGRKSLICRAKLFDASDNFLMDAAQSSIEVTRDKVLINGVVIAGVSFDDIYNFTEKGKNLLKTLKVNETQIIGDFV